MTVSTQPPGGSGGFTLVEVLVVMALLSAVMLALGSALRTVAQAEERIDQRLGRADEMRIAVAFVRSTLGRISGRKVVGPPPSTAAVLFAADRSSLAWIGIMPARYGAGGRYFFRLAVEPDQQQQAALMVRFKPWVDAAVFPDWSGAEARVLAKNLTGVAMSYMDTEEGVSWTSTWTAKDRLPDLLRIEVETAAGGWPPLIIPMRLLVTSDPRSGGAVFGPE